MTLPRNRWLLPVGHLLVDCVIALLWIWHGEVLASHLNVVTSPHSLVPPDQIQVDPGVDMQYYEPPSPEFISIASGNLVAAAASVATPSFRAAVATIEWQRAWFSMYEALTFPLWLVLGVGADTGFFGIGKWLRLHLGARAGTALFAVTEFGAKLSALASLLFWTWLTLYVVVRVCAWGWERLRRRGRPLAE